MSHGGRAGGRGSVPLMVEDKDAAQHLAWNRHRTAPTMRYLALNEKLHLREREMKAIEFGDEDLFLIHCFCNA